METAAAPAIRAVVVGSSGGPGPPITQQAITATTQQQHNNGNTVGHHHPPHQVYVQPHQRHSLMAPIVMHRAADSQGYVKPPQQSVPRSAVASPLSPQRPGPGTYSSFTMAPAREAPMRYLQPSPYGAAVPYRENPYVRIPNVDYVRTHTPDSSTRPRISLLAPACGTEYLRPLQGSPDSGGQPLYKKVRLNSGESAASAAIPPQLKIDTREPPAGAYHPQVEAISPTLPPDHYEDQLKSTKDELLASISKVDREIAKAEIQIFQLKKEEDRLQEVAVKPNTGSETESEKEPRHRSLAQKIYADNRKRAAQAHAELFSLGPPTLLPLYQQPRDASAWCETKAKYSELRPRLLLHFKKLKAERLERETQLAERYTQLGQEWQRRVDRAENSAKRRAKDAKNREFFEKVFPELRKQREDKERFNRVGARIKSEADLEEIMDGLQEQAMEDKKMRSYAVIPPLPYDARRRKMTYTNDNGACADMERDYKERKNLNVWTAGEREVFREKYLQHPKNFGAISACLERKTAQDCVRYYYLNKKTENYKQLLRKSRQRTRSSRSNVGRNQASGPGTTSIPDVLTSGVTTRLQREQQQKTGLRDNNVVGSSALAVVSVPKEEPISIDSNNISNNSDNICGSNNANDNVSTVNESIIVNSSTFATVSSESTSNKVVSDILTNNMILMADTAVTDPPSVPLITPGTPAEAPPLTEAEEEFTTAAEVVVNIAEQNTTASINSTIKKPKSKEMNSTSEEEHTVNVSAEKLQNCFICKMDTAHSRLLAKSHAQQYGMTEEMVPQGARVCNTCRCKYVRSRFTACPLPTCPNSKDRVKRLRSLPKRWNELPQNVRDPIIEEFKIPSPSTKCCSACYNRISRRVLNLHLQEDISDPTQRFTEEEVVSFKNLLGEHGSQWKVIADVLSKTVYQIKNFYFNYRKKHGLEEILSEYNQKNGIDTKPMLTDEEDSGSTTSSCDEQDNVASDTASAASPSCDTPLVSLREGDEIEKPIRNQINNETLISVVPTAPDIPSAISSKIVGKDEYDSSATETADEENESPTTRQSPKVLLQPVYQSSAATNQNGPAALNQSSRLDSMGDVMLNVIEQMVKNNTAAPQKPGSAPLLGKKSELPFVRDFRAGDSTLNTAINPNNKIQQNSLATLSVVNPHGHSLSKLPNQQILSPSQIATTITPIIQNIVPVNAPNVPVDVSKDVLVVLSGEPESETLDLSIKKGRENSNFVQQSLPPPAHSKTTMQNASVNSSNINYRHSNEPHYTSYHHEATRKSPSVFVSTIPQQHSLIVQRPGLDVSPQTVSKMSTKHNPIKLCSKIMHSQPKGGSIMHGTPLNQTQSSILNTTSSPRYENLLRQTPPDSNKTAGSITQGTPVHLPPHHLQDKRMYDYYNKRQSPAQLSVASNTPVTGQSPSNFPPYNQSNCNTTGFTSAYTRPPTYNIEQQLSSRQIIITDYITSQQMHGQGRRTIEKEQLNRGPITSSPASVYYSDKDRNARQDYLSRTSPAEHSSSVPSPHHTPPPSTQRQGVIQRHNTHTGQTHNNKPPSPATSGKLHHIQSPIHHYPPPGHEAFSSLVDVAVQQPSLPVPQKEEKRPEILTPSPSSHHDIRYQQDRIARDRDLQHLQIQQFQQQQQQLQRQQHAVRMAELDIHRRQQQQQQQLLSQQQSASQQQHYRGQPQHSEREQYYIHRSNLDRQQQLEGDRLRQQQLHNDKDRERGAIDKLMESERSRDLEREERLRRDRETTRLLVGCIPREATSSRVHDRKERQITNERTKHTVQRSTSPEQLTAAKLIDAIITHQINQTSDDTLAAPRDGRPNFINAFHRDQPQVENNGKSHSPNVINIDPEASDHQSQQQPQSRPNSNVSQKSMTLGDLTDSIISNDFNNSTCGYPLTFRSNCNVPYSQDNIASSEQWKLRRSVQQKEIADRDKNSRSNTPDERQVIRISQPVDARSGKQTQHVSSYHEPVAGQTNERVYGNKSSGSSSQQRLPKPPAKHISAFDYVTNRIVEVMRTEDDNKRLNIEEQEIKQQDISKSELKEQDRCSTPGEMVIDETSDTSATKLDTISSCPNQSSVQVTTTYPSTAYNYPFGAHNVSSQGTQQITKSVNIDIAQPKPLLSAQYEPLSDED